MQQNTPWWADHTEQPPVTVVTPTPNVQPEPESWWVGHPTPCHVPQPEQPMLLLRPLPTSTEQQPTEQPAPPPNRASDEPTCRVVVTQYTTADRQHTPPTPIQPATPPTHGNDEPLPWWCVVLWCLGLLLALLIVVGSVAFVVAAMTNSVPLGVATAVLLGTGTAACMVMALRCC